MKRILLLLLISLFPKIFSFSQTIYPKQLNDSVVAITSFQLKQTNLIFRDHYRLRAENIQLYKQLDYTQQMLSNAEKKDQIYKDMIASLQTTIADNQEYYEVQMKLQERKCIKIVTIGGIGISITMLILICLR